MSTSAGAASRDGSQYKYLLGDVAQAVNLLDDFTSLVLRHTFGTDFVRKGTDLATPAAELMGRVRVETTRSYALPTDENRRKAINTLLTDC